ncbi:hypothetical protein SAMN05519103_00699 [Rhizobiales bacterium GAS113]|nr:hypothetical protein SAMN05519103_00699 [Rhizobiales bacterium GAS113]
MTIYAEKRKDPRTGRVRATGAWIIEVGEKPNRVRRRAKTMPEARVIEARLLASIGRSDEKLGLAVNTSAHEDESFRPRETAETATVETYDRFGPLGEQERRAAERLDDALAMLLVAGISSVGHARSLLAVALEPGAGSADYAKRVGSLQPVISRHLLELGIKARTGGPGLGLIDRQSDPADLRNHRNYLTSNGKRAIAALSSILQRG